MRRPQLWTTESSRASGIDDSLRKTVRALKPGRGTGLASRDRTSVLPFTTLGAEGSFLNVGGFDYPSANLLFRFYPQHALAGFFVGGRAGVHHVAGDEATGASANFFGAGVDIGYSWLLGPRRNVDVSIGLGAERLFGGSLVGVSLTLPSLRLLNVGVAF